MKSVRAFAPILLALACLGLTVQQASASSAENTTVTFVGVGPNYTALCGFPCMMIALASAPTGSSCAMDAGWHYAIALNSEDGRAAAAMVLSAKATGAIVEAHGSNTCVFNNRVERLSNFLMR